MGGAARNRRCCSCANSGELVDKIQQDFNEFLGETIELQRKIERMLRLAISVLNGPDDELRSEGMKALGDLADTLARSTARLGEFRQ